MSRPLLVMLVLVMISLFSVQQRAATDQVSHGKRIKIVRVNRTNPTSGAEMYQSYCASCHGTAGKGNGAAAELLPAPPPDLTQLARQNGNKYPWGRVHTALKLGNHVHEKGTVGMPDWERLFRSLDFDRTMVDLRIDNLTDHVKSLQE